MPIEKQIEDAWAAHRPYLVDLAFRMLGDIGRAEDVVQEAFARLSQNIDTVEDQRGWLIVVTSRLCLDQIGSAQARREYATDVEVLERHAGPQGVDPADRVTLDDSIRLALLVVMERLTPPERVAYGRLPGDLGHDLTDWPIVGLNGLRQVLCRSATAGWSERRPGASPCWRRRVPGSTVTCAQAGLDVAIDRRAVIPTPARTPPNVKESMGFCPCVRVVG